MKIDEFIRDTMVKMEPAAKGKVEAGISASPELTGLLVDSMPDTDFFFPDLLQAFGKLLARRQDLLDVLPQSVQNRLPETTESNGSRQTVSVNSPENTPAVNPTFPQGVSGLARDSRVMTETLRQIIAELEFVERVPDLEKIVDSQTPKYEIGSFKSSIADSQSIASTANTLHPVTMEEIPELVKVTLQALQSSISVEKATATSAMLFLRQSAQALQSGQLAPDFSAWVDEVVATLDYNADKVAQEPTSAKWLNQVDPQILRVAQATGRPELIRVWAVVQEISATSISSPQTPAETLANPASPISGAAVAIPQDKLPYMRSVVEKLVALPMPPQPVATNAQPVTTSQISQFELLLSSVAARPELLEKLIAALPKTLPTKELLQSDKVKLTAYETLTQAAPKWLKAMVEREERPALLQFWVAAKVADLKPWLTMEPLERQQLITALKELNTTYEQPEAFRTPREDTASRSFMMQIPLYAPGQETPYPALIQVFEEKKERGNGQLPEQEVWVRVSLETDHIGTVDLSFRLQDKKYLSIFSRFANPDAASEFRASLPELRKEMAGTSLELKKIAVAGRIHPGGKGDG
jgi:hypothetical protein